MRHGLNRLPGWQKSVLYGAGGALLATGSAWLVLHHGRGESALPSPWEAWTMRVHGLAGFAALFVFGALAASHVPRGWRFSQRPRRGRQRNSGAALCGLAGLLAGTGYLLITSHRNPCGASSAGCTRGSGSGPPPWCSCIGAVA